MASKFFLVTVFMVDLIAFGLALSAEQRRTIAEVVGVGDGDEYYSYCLYGSDIASFYGAGAFILLMITQILTMVASRCLCCGKPLGQGESKSWAIFLFFTSWVCFFIAEACLFAGSVRNATHTRYRTLYDYKNPPSCEILRQGTFAAGAAFTLLTAIVSELYYFNIGKARDKFQRFGAGKETGANTRSY